MQFNTFVSCREDILSCAQSKYIKEVLLEPSLLAREGRLTVSEARELALYAHSLGLRTVLVWDILLTEEDLAECAKGIAQVGPEIFSAIRVQCSGAARFLKEHYPSSKVQLIAEVAHCNLRTLQLWCEILGPQLERIILSIQLPAEKIAEYARLLPVPCEILGIGRILLFYSRRNLLKKNFGDLGESWREVLAESEESHNRPFPVIDNTHGTFMYLDKDQFVVHRLAELKNGIPDYLRVDLRHLSEFPNSASNIVKIVSQALDSPDLLRESWPRPTIAPFFKSNLTTKQFKFLNSELRYSRDEKCVAEVVSTERDKHAVLRVIQPFSLPGQFRAVDPSGVELCYEFDSVKNLEGQKITHTESDQIVLVPWMRKISTGALVIKEIESTSPETGV